jgi:hypothetical protein
MEFHGIDEFMRYLKIRYDESERKQDWRALSGRDHVSSNYDTFIFTDRSVFQIKACEFVPKEMAAVAREVGPASPDMVDMIKGGAPVPLNVISQAKDAGAVVMFGMQQYSSDITDVFRREYFHSRQDELKSELANRVDNMIDRPEYKRAYRSLRRSQDSSYS